MNDKGSKKKLAIEADERKKTMKTKRCKICGNYEFMAQKRIHTRVIVDGLNSFIRDIKEKNQVDIYHSEAPYGPYKCTVCGEEYDDLSELGTCDIEGGGTIHYYFSDEKIEYDNDEELINRYEDVLNYTGPMGQMVTVKDSRNIALQYKLHNINAGEFGIDEISFKEYVKEYVNDLLK